MAPSRSIKALLALAAETSAVDDKALDELAQRLLADVVLDPDAPVELKVKAARLLRAAPLLHSPAPETTPFVIFGSRQTPR